MGTYLLKRLLYLFPMSFIVVFFSGVMIHFIPGDPVDQIAGDFSSEQERRAIRKNMGLDQPVPLQVLYYFKGVIQGDLGHSLIDHRAVSELILERILPTVELALTSIVLACLVSIPLGAWAAVFKGSKIDSILMLSSLIGLSMPSFLLGPLLILFFSVQMGWLPVSGRSGLSSIILPSIVLSSSLSASLLRITKVSFLEQLGADYIRTARSKGLGEILIFTRHVFKNAALSITTMIGLQFGALVTGTIITEKVFDWPGLGTLIAESIERRDYPVVQGCVFTFSLFFLLTNLITDLCYFGLDPRIRLARFD